MNHLPAQATIIGRSGQHYRAIHWELGEYRVYRGNSYVGSSTWHGELGLLIYRSNDGACISEAEWQSICDALESHIAARDH